MTADHTNHVKFQRPKSESVAVESSKEKQVPLKEKHMKFRPLGDKILVKRDEAATKTESGIFLPESSKEKPKQGKIVALGDGHRSKDNGKVTPFTVKKGDSVIFSSYAGTEIKIDGESLLIMTEEDILGVIE